MTTSISTRERHTGRALGPMSMAGRARLQRFLGAVIAAGGDRAGPGGLREIATGRGAVTRCQPSPRTAPTTGPRSAALATTSACPGADRVRNPDRRRARLRGVEPEEGAELLEPLRGRGQVVGEPPAANDDGAPLAAGDRHVDPVAVEEELHAARHVLGGGGGE